MLDKSLKAQFLQVTSVLQFPVCKMVTAPLPLKGMA